MIKNTRVYRMQEIRTEYFLHLFSFKTGKESVTIKRENWRKMVEYVTDFYY